LSGKLFQTLAPAVGKARLPTVGMQAEGWNIKLIRRCRSQPSPVKHVSNSSEPTWCSNVFYFIHIQDAVTLCNYSPFNMGLNDNKSNL